MNRTQIMSVVNTEVNNNMHPDIRIRYYENDEGIRVIFRKFIGWDDLRPHLQNITSITLTTKMKKEEILYLLREITCLYTGDLTEPEAYRIRPEILQQIHEEYAMKGVSEDA